MLIFWPLCWHDLSVIFLHMLKNINKRIRKEKKSFVFVKKRKKNILKPASGCWGSHEASPCLGLLRTPWFFIHPTCAAKACIGLLGVTWSCSLPHFTKNSMVLHPSNMCGREPYLWHLEAEIYSSSLVEKDSTSFRTVLTFSLQDGGKRNILYQRKGRTISCSSSS